MFNPLCIEYVGVDCENCPCYYHCPFDIERPELPFKSYKRAERRRLSQLKNQRMRKMIIDFNALAGNIHYDFDENGQFVPVGNHIKYRSRSGDRRYLKRQSARLVRKTFDTLPRRQNEKLFDYWNQLY